MLSPSGDMPNSASAANSTPITTPNADSLPQPTSFDYDGQLQDTSDEAWAIILAFRLSVSRSLTEYRPSLASGLLVRRAGCSPEQHASPFPVTDEQSSAGPVCVAVNLLWICNSSGNASNNGSNNAGVSPALHAIGSRGYDNMLREILSMYGNLGLLAKYRGMRDTRGGVVPWHVVMVMRSLKALHACM